MFINDSNILSDFNNLWTTTPRLDPNILIGNTDNGNVSRTINNDITL
jgi:hypothetical protein